MARGWESKSVEEQIEATQSGRFSEVKDHLSPAQADLLRKKESLRLARARVLADLETVQNPRYRDLLSATLADLDAKLAALSNNDL
jgi:hypothetical protein